MQIGLAAESSAVHFSLRTKKLLERNWSQLFHYTDFLPFPLEHSIADLWAFSETAQQSQDSIEIRLQQERGKQKHQNASYR